MKPPPIKWKCPGCKFTYDDEQSATNCCSGIDSEAPMKRLFEGGLANGLCLDSPCPPHGVCHRCQFDRFAALLAELNLELVFKGE